MHVKATHTQANAHDTRAAQNMARTQAVCKAALWASKARREIVMSAEVRLLQPEEYGVATAVIRAGFVTVAERFGLTELNCPTNAAFLPKGRLAAERESGALLFGLFSGGDLCGCAQLCPVSEGVFELKKLAVLPQFRRNGFGEMLVRRVAEEARSHGGTKLTIGIIEENADLRDWYASRGFVHVGTRVFSHLPFTVGFMQMEL